MARKSSRCAGFLIVEVLIGLVIGIILTAVFTISVFYAMRSAASSRQRLQACMIARSSLEAAFITGTGADAGSGTLPSGFSVHVDLTRDATIKRLVRGTVSVTWPQGKLTLRSGYVL